jgi:serine/threonine protein kinase
LSECLRCHTPLPVDGRFCSNCGTPTGGLAHVCTDPVEELQARLTHTLAGRYEIIRVLGRGGMAVVFLAHDLVLEREVAIKVLPPEMSLDAKLIPRFQQEAKTAAKLDHPNIIPIYRVESEAGLDYFVMKYVNGRTLEQVLEAGPLPVPQARRVLREAALALGHAHRRRIVHRDVKPANIMLEDADGRVVLTDFGISKAAHEASQLTGTGTIIGTPHYMAPEQAKGAAVDGRADQYALAIVGHQILTGKLPFDGNAHSILYKQVFEPPPPMLELRPDTPGDLSRALERALSKDPAHRFATMEDFAAAVGGERSGTATVVSAPVKPLTKAAPPSDTESGSGTTKRPVLLAFMVAALGIAVTAWVGLRHFEPPSSLQAAASAPARQPVGQPPLLAPVAPSPIEAQAEAPARLTSRRERHPLRELVQSRIEEASPDAARPTLRVAKRDYALLTVASEPWGTLYIDNIEIGPTPVADYRLSSGTYRLRIEQEGYRTRIETIVVNSPNAIRRRYSLEPTE